MWLSRIAPNCACPTWQLRQKQWKHICMFACWSFVAAKSTFKEVFVSLLLLGYMYNDIDAPSQQWSKQVARGFSNNLTLDWIVHGFGQCSCYPIYDWRGAQFQNVDKIISLEWSGVEWSGVVWLYTWNSIIMVLHAWWYYSNDAIQSSCAWCKFEMQHATPHHPPPPKKRRVFLFGTLITKILF